MRLFKIIIIVTEEIKFIIGFVLFLRWNRYAINEGGLFRMLLIFLPAEETLSMII